MKADVRILLGPAGAGKTEKCFAEIVDAAAAYPAKQFYLVVPDQAGSSTEQRILAVNRERTGRPGFFNLDIPGFTRLAYRIFSEEGLDTRQVLGEYGKTILLRAVMADTREELKVYQGSVDRRGFVEEIKSLVSEFLLFDIQPEELEQAAEQLSESDRQLRNKLQDVITVYRQFREDPVFQKEYMTAEELEGYLARFLMKEGPIPAVDGAVFYFDGFTGFTAGQRKVIAGLLPRAAEMHFTITMDPDPGNCGMFVQSREMLEQLLKMAPDCRILKLRPVPSDTPLSHLERHAFRFPIREYKGNCGDALSVWMTENPLEELRVVAEDIRNGVREGKLRYRDAVILTPDPEGLGSFLDYVMREYELPYYADVTRSFTNNPIIDAMLFSLEIIDRDYTYEPVFAFLKTGVLDAALEAEGVRPEVTELLENHVLAHGIRGRKLWGRSVESVVKHPEERLEELRQMDTVRLLLMDVLKPLQPFARGKKAKVSEMIHGLKRLAQDPRLNMSGREGRAEDELFRLGYPAEARAYRGLTEKFLEVLERTEDILGEVTMTVHELRETLMAGAAELHLGTIPPTIDRVLVGDLTRTRIDMVKRLYIINLNEGIFPRPSSGSGIFSDRDRTRIDQVLSGKALAPGESRKREEEQFSLYRMMSKAGERLILTYSLTSRNGSEMQRSSLLGRVLRLFPDLAEEKRKRCTISGLPGPDRIRLMTLLRQNDLTEEEKDEKEALLLCFPGIRDLTERKKQGLETLPVELMKEMDLRISVSGMEHYANCPYEYFLQYILGLKPRSLHEVREADVGNILHRGLELLFREVKEKHGNDWKTLKDEELLSMAREKLMEAAREMEFLPQEEADEEESFSKGKNQHILRQLEELMTLNLSVLKRQLKDSSLLPEVMEGSFEAEFTAEYADGSPKTVLIRGIIDRVDTFSGEDGTVYLRLVDYKTGDKKLDPRDLRDGRNIQLSLYMRILTEIFERKSKDAVPAGMYYYHVDRPILGSLSDKAVEAAGGISNAAAEEVGKKLRLTGIPNVSPLEGEESDLPQHYILELQEKGAVGADRSLQTAVSLPITVSAKEHKLVGNTLLADTEEMYGLGEYGLLRMKQMTEEILSGSIPRRPTRVAGRMENSCGYCPVASVCLLRTEEVRERYVPACPDGKSLMKELAEQGNNAPVALRNARLRDKAGTEELREIREEAYSEDMTEEEE